MKLSKVYSLLPTTIALQIRDNVEIVSRETLLFNYVLSDIIRIDVYQIDKQSYVLVEMR